MYIHTHICFLYVIKMILSLLLLKLISHQLYTNFSFAQHTKQHVQRIKERERRRGRELFVLYSPLDWFACRHIRIYTRPQLNYKKKTKSKKAAIHTHTTKMKISRPTMIFTPVAVICDLHVFFFFSFICWREPNPLFNKSSLFQAIGHNDGEV